MPLNFDVFDVKPTVTTIGGAMVDTIAVIEDELIERMRMDNADRSFLLLEQGRKTEASIISTHSGGGAINSAVSFARLGYDVSPLVKLGYDSRADIVLGTLEREKISRNNVSITQSAGTGASVLISAHERNAAVFTFRGANSYLDSTDLADAKLSANLTYVSSLSDGSAELFGEIVETASTSRSYVVANPGIRQLAARGLQFENALPQIDLLSMNRDEAAVLIPRLSSVAQKLHWATPVASEIAQMNLWRRGFVSSGFEMSLEHFCAAILQKGAKCVLITDGKYGAYAVTAASFCFCASQAVPVIGTAGAGDAFTSTFAATSFEGASTIEALQCASINAASVIGFADTQTGLLRRDELGLRYAESGPGLATAYFTSIN
jgi:ribokinase